MPRPSKPIAKNSNSRFSTRNNKQEIFSRISKVTKTKADLDKKAEDVSKHDENTPN